jgi:hypothetical protein
MIHEKWVLPAAGPATLAGGITGLGGAAHLDVRNRYWIYDRAKRKIG